MSAIWSFGGDAGTKWRCHGSYRRGTEEPHKPQPTRPPQSGLVPALLYCTAAAAFHSRYQF